MSEQLPRWTDDHGQTWELVRPPRPQPDLSDAALELVMGLGLLVPGLVLSVAHLLFALPDWLAPIDGVLILFGLTFLLAGVQSDDA